MFPDKFEDFLRQSLSEQQCEALTAALGKEPETSVRYNPYKISARPQGEPVPWNRYGFYLSERPQFTLDPVMHAGGYYVQEASSMFVEHLYRQTVGEANGTRLLDLCAAPGGKTTLYSTLVGADGLVVANEPVKQRATVLADNVRRWGIGNVAVTCCEPQHFKDLDDWFDVLAIDAPCSGEGMFRKNSQARDEWSADAVAMCAARQRRIISEAWHTLRPGGVLIYSTCTFNRKENEENVRWIYDNFECEGVEIECPEQWGIVRGDVCGIPTFRFYPHMLRGEGFFAAVLRKADRRARMQMPRARREVMTDLQKKQSAILSRWVNQPQFMRFAAVGDNCYGFYRSQFGAVKALAQSLNVIYSGVCMGQLFGDKFRPDHSLALFHDLNVSQAATARLTKEQALDFLRRKDPADINVYEQGLNLVCYDDMPIGWIKRIGGRTNSLLPVGFRIVNL